jgi:imidazole glycerol-phosphate synthase subunit HisH
MSINITIIDYGMGNLFSVKKKLARLNSKVIISSHEKDIINADKIILPGVGHFEKAMENLKKLQLIPVLNHAIIDKKKPVLGICLGMQLMSNKSEEGNINGLGWIDANVIKFKVNDSLNFKIPHMGWNQITIAKKSKLMKNISNGNEFYFVHSFHMKAKQSIEILNETFYEKKFTSAIEKENVFGVQYHPEKSHKYGEIILKNFIDL